MRTNGFVAHQALKHLGKHIVHWEHGDFGGGGIRLQRNGVGHDQFFQRTRSDAVVGSARRKLYSIVPENKWGSKVFDTLAERYKERNGGYTRIMKAGFRYGDSAPMAVIELVDRDPEALGQDSGPIIEKDFEELEA